MIRASAMARLAVCGAGLMQLACRAPASVCLPPGVTAAVRDARTVCRSRGFGLPGFHRHLLCRLARIGIACQVATSSLVLRAQPVGAGGADPEDFCAGASPYQPVMPRRCRESDRAGAARRDAHFVGAHGPASRWCRASRAGRGRPWPDRSGLSDRGVMPPAPYDAVDNDVSSGTWLFAGNDTTRRRCGRVFRQSHPGAAAGRSGKLFCRILGRPRSSAPSAAWRVDPMRCTRAAITRRRAKRRKSFWWRLRPSARRRKKTSSTFAAARAGPAAGRADRRLVVQLRLSDVIRIRCDRAFIVQVHGLAGSSAPARIGFASSQGLRGGPVRIVYVSRATPRDQQANLKTPMQVGECIWMCPSGGRWVGS